MIESLPYSRRRSRGLPPSFLSKVDYAKASIPEPEVILNAKNGDTECATILYEENKAKVFKYALKRVGIIEDAEDVTQRVFTKVFESLSDYEDRGSPIQAWIMKIARNEVVIHTRKSHPAEYIENDDIHHHHIDKTNVEETVLKKMDIAKVAEAVNNLTPAQREVILLRYGKDLSPEQVAKVLGKSKNLVNGLQHKGVHSLRRILQHEFELGKL